MIAPTELFTQLLYIFNSLPPPNGLLLPVCIRYKISPKASLNLEPYIASILFKFLSENIISTLSCHSCKNKALLSPTAPSSNKSEVIFSANQYCFGSLYTFSFLDIKPTASA